MRCLLLGPVLCLALAACGRSDPGTASPTPDKRAQVLRVKVVKPERREVVRRVTLPGTVRADKEVVLHGKLTGYVKSISKDRGDRVKAGELIATLEVPEMVLELDSARASFDLEDATLRRLEAIRKAERAAVTDQDLDVARGKRSMADAAVKRLQTLHAYTQIRAPFDGVVTERFVDPGAFLQQGRIISLTDSSVVRVIVDVPEAEVRFAQPGTSANIHFQALGDDGGFEAKITRVASSLDVSTRTMRVELEMPNSKGTIFPGMFAKVKIDVEKRANALVIPQAAIVDEHDKTFVFVSTNGHAKKVAVTLGAVEGKWTEAATGLKGDEPIILPTAEGLSDGSLVQGEEGK